MWEADAVQKIVGNYFDLHHRSVANYYLPQLVSPACRQRMKTSIMLLRGLYTLSCVHLQPDGSLKKILMTIERQPHSSSDRTARRTATYWITPDDLGPLDTVRRELRASRVDVVKVSCVR